MSDRRFLEEIVHAIPGWLEDYTALRTMDLLKFQEDAKLAGSLFEIGVFAGRYFSILLDSARKTNATIVGLDTFQYIDVPETLAHLRTGFSGDYAQLLLLVGPSSEWDAPRLTNQLGEPARFISVDGSHDKSDVFWDLRLAEDLAATAGIVAVDDFLNPMTPGVNEAVNQFFAQPRNLVPWAYIANKLLLCRPSWASRYKEFLEADTLHRCTEERSRIFAENLGKSRDLVEVTLFGATILIWP